MTDFNPVLDKFKSSTSPFQDRMKPIKKDGVGGKKDQLLADRDAYLQLLLTQLKNQNPQSPTDTNQMTQNIVAISQAEQSITTNEHLEQLVKMQEHSHKASVVSYIGKEVEYDNAQQQLEFGSASFNYTMPKDAERMKISILDSKGNPVKSVGTDKAQRSAGNHQFIWDGKDDSGRQLYEGQFSIKIDAYKEDGAPIYPSTTIKAKVDGVMENFGNFELILDNNSRITVDKLMGIYAGEQNIPSDKKAIPNKLDLSNIMDNLNDMIAN